MQVYSVNGLTRIRPRAAPRPPEPIIIRAARNEFEPFQVVVLAGTGGLHGVDVQVTDLRPGNGPVISRDHIRLFREHVLTVSKPTRYSKDGTGDYPDALIPWPDRSQKAEGASPRFVAAPFDVAPGANQVIWVDVFVPKGTLPGAYSGALTVLAQGQKPASITIRLMVWNFTLPDTPSLRSNFGGIDSRVAKAHHLEPGSTEFRTVQRRYAAAMAEHRLCPPIPDYLMPKILPDGSVDPSATHAALKEWIDTFHVTGIPIDFIGDDPLGKDRERNTRFFQSIYAYLKTNGWEKYAYNYVLDEPNDSAAYELVRRRARLIHDSQPGIKVLCTEQPTPEQAAWGTLVGSVDIWVPLWTLYDEPAANARLAAGEELWSYTALCQGSPSKHTPYWEMDFPLLNYRIPGVMSWRHGMTGLLYWTMVYWEKTDDVWTNPLTYQQYNGEGSLFYPGADAGFAGPVASIRLKQIREGIEDYEYLALLARTGQKAFADNCARQLASSWTNWDEDTAHLYSIREEMAEKLNSINPTASAPGAH